MIACTLTAPTHSKYIFPLPHNSPLTFKSFNTLSATRKASIPAGMPQYALSRISHHPVNLLCPSPRPQIVGKSERTHVACNKASLISTSLAPFLTAPLTCVANSVDLPNAVSITRFRRLRVLRSRPGRVQIVDHAASCF